MQFLSSRFGIRLAFINCNGRSEPPERVMSRCRYYVIYDGSAWTIQCDGVNSEAYSRRVDAFRDAVALAHLDERNGREADVIVQDEGDSFRAEWVSSKNTYPPPLVPDSQSSVENQTQSGESFV